MQPWLATPHWSTGEKNTHISRVWSSPHIVTTGMKDHKLYANPPAKQSKHHPCRLSSGNQTWTKTSLQYIPILSPMEPQHVKDFSPCHAWLEQGMFFLFQPLISFSGIRLAGKALCPAPPKSGIPTPRKTRSQRVRRCWRRRLGQQWPRNWENIQEVHHAFGAASPSWNVTTCGQTYTVSARVKTAKHSSDLNTGLFS